MSQNSSLTYHLLFTGHMIDKPGRKEPRFPASKEANVRQRIKTVVQEEKNSHTGRSLIGIAGGACGGDILFHEICEEQGIPSQMPLALPREKLLHESVAFAGDNWIKRFDSLYQKLPHPVLSMNADEDTWVRNNLWLLNSALAGGGENMTLIALWDGKGGDGPGGTEHMVKVVKEKGAKAIVIDMKSV